MESLVEIINTSEIKISGLEIRGIPAILAATAVTVAVIKRPKIVSDIVGVFKSICQTAVTRLAPGSVIIEVLTYGDDGLEKLLQAYASGELLKRLKTILSEGVKELSIELTSIGVILDAQEEDFVDIYNEVQQNIKDKHYHLDASGEVKLSTSSILTKRRTVNLPATETFEEHIRFVKEILSLLSEKPSETDVASTSSEVSRAQHDEPRVYEPEGQSEAGQIYDVPSTFGLKPPRLPMAENEKKRSKSKPINRLNPRHQIKDEGYIMFSYHWSDSQPTAFKIRDALRFEGYPIWIDIEQMHGDMNEQIANAIEKADVVLMFLSPKYEKSHNLMKEASYADKLHKPIIPIYTQKGYEPKGKCGLITAGKLYFDFSVGSFDDNLSQLIWELEQINRISRNEDKKSLDQILQEAQEKRRVGEDSSKVLSDEPKANNVSDSPPQDTVKDDLESTDVGEDTDKCLEDESITTDLPTSSSQESLTDCVKSADQMLNYEDGKNANQILQEARKKRRVGEDNSKSNEPKRKDLSESSLRDTAKDDLQSTDVGEDTDKCLEDKTITTDLPPSSSQDTLTDCAQSAGNKDGLLNTSEEETETIRMSEGSHGTLATIKKDLFAAVSKAAQLILIFLQRIYYNTQNISKTPEVESATTKSSPTTSGQSEAGQIYDVPSTFGLKLRRLPMAENEKKRSKSKPINRLNSRHQIKDEGYIMFSYHWSNSQTTVFKIRDALRFEGYPIWIDIEQMHGDMNEQIANAIEKADVVLMFLSPKYEKSHNLMKEASYADKLHKPIIPIYTQKGYEPKGKCGLITAGKLYFDFSVGSFDDNLSQLIWELEQINRISRNEDKKSLDQILQEAQEKRRVGEDSSKVLSDEPKANNVSDSPPQDTVKDDLESTDLIRGDDLYCDFPGGRFSDESFKLLLSYIKNQWNKKFSEGKLTREKSSSVQKNPGEEAVNHILECQNKCILSDVKPIKVLKVVNKLPEVYPLLVEALFYEGEAVINDKYRPSSRKVKVCRTVKVNVDDIFSLIEKERFVALIGPAGCGKTTLSKRLVESKVYKCFHVELRKTGYKEKLTLRQFLLENQFPDVSPNTIESAFEWIKNQKNQKKCLFILDGLNEAGWANMLKKPECPKRYEESTSVHELVARLFYGSFLAESHLLVTSRPHTMLTLCEEIRPHLTILVQDLHFLSMKKLFDSYCSDRKEEIWERLDQTAPQLKTLCFNPLMLQFVVGLLLHSSKKVGPISTLTHLFASVLKSIEVTSERKKDLPTTLKHLSKLSYQGIKDSSVVFTSQQLDDVDLDKVQVQDIMVSAMANNDESFLSQLVDGEEQFFFSHQTFQEYLCAVYIANDMPIFNFNKFIEQDLFKPHWSMVKKFLCGYLYDDNVYSINIVEEKAIESRTTRQEKLKGKIEQQLNEFKYTWQEADVPSQIDTSSQPDWKHQDSDFEQQDSASEGLSQIKSKESSSIVEADKPDTSTSHHPLHYHHQKLVEFEEVRSTLDDDVLESLAKQRALVDLWASIQECNKDDMTTLAVKLFPLAIDLSYQEWSLNEIVAISSMLERVVEPIEKLSFICCSLDSHLFAYLAKGIKDMKGSIGSLKLIHNKLKRKRKDDKKEEDNTRDGLDMICEIMPKVREELDIWNCFVGDDGEYRSFTDDEKDVLQEVLDKLDDTTLKIGIGLINDEEVTLQHHMANK